MESNPDPLPAAPRKVKFAPRRLPPRRTPGISIVPKIEEAANMDLNDDDEAQEHADLSRKVKEHITRNRSKVEKKSSVQVAFSHGTAASSSIRTFGKQKEKIENGSDAADDVEELVSDYKKKLRTNINTSTAAGAEIVHESTTGYLTESSDTTVKKKKKEYREPWDYNSYYPTTLPLRRPYSGNPELLDIDEFENAEEYDENTLNSAAAIGLLGQDDDAPQMLFLKFPPNIPLGTTADNLKAASKGKEIAGSSLKGKEIAGSSVSNPVSGRSTSRKVCSLEELPDGYMGKMLVYKSGAVKLKLGDVLCDVSPGTDCKFAQSVAAINTTSKECVDLGAVNKLAVVSPDVDSLLDNMVNLD